MTKKILVPLSLVAYTLIIILPAIIHRYIYPNMGDDFASNVNFIQNFNLFHITYYGYVYIGYPLRWIHSLTGFSIVQMLLVFYFIVIVAVGFSTYFVLSRLVNWKAGLLSLVFPFFVSVGMAGMFDFGMIFDIINVGIILPFLIYFSIRWIRERKAGQLAISLVLAFVLGNFHSDGVFMVPVLLVLLVGYYAWQWHKKHPLDNKVVMFLFSMMAIGVIDNYALWNPTRFASGIYHTVLASNSMIHLYIIATIIPLVIYAILLVRFKQKKALFLWSSIVYLAFICVSLVANYVMVGRESMIQVYAGVVNPTITKLNPWYDVEVIEPFLLILFLGLIYLAVIHRFKIFDSVNKLLLYAFGVIIVIWAGFIAVVSAGTSDRVLYDLSIVIALATAVLAGLLWNKNLMLKFMVALVIIFGMANMLPQWTSYKSTVTQADKDAIAYLNTLPDMTYTTSSQVEPAIYGMYIKEQYQQDSKELLITRNTPMTINSDINGHSYLPHGIDGTDGFTLDKSFTDGKIIVDVYEGAK